MNEPKKRLLVTGGAGFIGTNFIRHVLSVRPDWSILNLDKLTYAGNPMNFQDLNVAQTPRYRFIHGDILDCTLLEQLFSKEYFQAIVHFAAESHVDRSVLDPEIFLETNVKGTFYLLEASRKYLAKEKGVKAFRFLHVSTDEVYGSLGPDGYFTERAPYNPSSPYAASKAAADHFVKSYFRTYHLPILITNCSNNFGPYQFPEKLIPFMILNILEEKPLPVYGDGTNIRDWLFVLDHCEALLKVLEDGAPGETYNIGGGSERQNIEVVHSLCDLMDARFDRTGSKSSRRLIEFVSDRPGHDFRYAIDATKIEEELGWRPRHGFEEALKTTVHWYLEHLDWVRSVQSGEYKKWIEANYARRSR